VTTETQNPNPNDQAADAHEAGEDTALGAAAKAGEEGGANDVKPDAGKPGEGDDDAGKDEGSEDGKGDKAAEQPAGAPEKYDTAAFTMPEGIEFDSEAFGAFEPALRDLNLSQDQAGKLVGVYAEKLVPLIEQRTVQKMDESAAELRANLARELQDDPEVGGKKLDESRSFAAKAIAHFIPDAKDRAAFSEFLNESGFGNNRFLMRLTAGAGRVVSEASTPAGESSAAPITESQKFYGKGGN
jgi:hypothetical protein